MKSYRVAAMTGERTIEFRDLEIINPTGKQVLVKVDSCAICTLEQRVFSGVMRYYPFAGGHEYAGIIERVGNDVQSLKPGDKVAARLLTNCGVCHYCRTGHENQCVINFQASVHKGLNGPGGFSEFVLLEESSLYKMADEIELSHAALTEPLACCVHSIGQADIRLADEVVVIGAGIMGAFHILLAKLRGARVIACELNNHRLQIAKTLGADVLVDAKSNNCVEAVKIITDGRGADAVFCTVASPQSAAEAIAMAGKLGRVVMYSSFHPKDPISLDVNHVHYSEMIITGSVNPLIRDFHVASRLLSNKIIDPTPLISARFPFSELEQALTVALDPESYRIIVNM